MLEMGDINLHQFVRDVYELSVPQGLGWLHATSKPLSDEDVEEILGRGDDQIALRMDYVQGRSCKMTLFKENGTYQMNTPWYDHTDKQLQELLSRHEINSDSNTEHGPACNCVDCQQKQGGNQSGNF